MCQIDKYGVDYGESTFFYSIEIYCADYLIFRKENLRWVGFESKNSFSSFLINIQKKSYQEVTFLEAIFA